MQNYRLTAKEILDKDFKTSMKGYNKDEVDQFLDQIIQDYEAFTEKIQQLEAELKKRDQTKPPERPSEVPVYEPETPSFDTYTQAGTGTNYDILKRLSNLEKEVFGKKLYD